jgi:hypothetical protein
MTNPKFEVGGFASGTLVHVPHGTVSIESLRVGDEVICVSPRTLDKLETRRVHRVEQAMAAQVHFVDWQLPHAAEDVYFRGAWQKPDFVVAAPHTEVWVLREAQNRSQGRYKDISNWLTLAHMHGICEFAKNGIQGLEPLTRMGCWASLNFVSPILATSQPNQGVCFYDSPEWRIDKKGIAVYFEPTGPAVRLEYSRVWGELPVRVQVDIAPLPDAGRGYAKDSTVRRSGGYHTMQLPVRRVLLEEDGFALLVGRTGLLAR